MTYREAIKESLDKYKTPKLMLFNRVVCGGTYALPVYFPRLLMSLSILITQIYINLNDEDEVEETNIIDFAVALAGKDHISLRICLSRIIYDFIDWLLDEEIPENGDSVYSWYDSDTILEKFIEFQEEETD